MVETHVCWNCGVTVAMTERGRYTLDLAASTGGWGEVLVHFYLMECPACGKPSIAHLGVDAHELEWISTGVRGRDFPDVPVSIARAASEAHVCLSAGAYRGAIILARAVVEASCKEKGITKGHLAQKIEALHERGIMNSQVHAEATEVRHLGNDMAHGDFIEEATLTDAEDILGFMAEVLEEVFQRPARVARRKEKRGRP